MKHKIKISILIVNLVAITACCKDLTHIKKYDLSINSIMEECSPWIGYSIGMNYHYDSLISFYGKNPVIIYPSFNKIANSYIKNYYSDLLLQQWVTFASLTDSINIEFFQKGNYKNNGKVTFALLNKHDSICQTITIDLRDNYGWEKIRFTTTTKNISHMLVQIASNFMQSSISDNFSIGISDIKIEASHNDHDHENRNKSRYTITDNAEIFNLEKNIQNKNIIGIGETLHGSSSLNYQTFEIMKRMIEKNSCKLILFELPSPLVIIWDNFVQGKIDINVRDEVEKYKTFSPNDICEFLVWLHKYNKESEEKVHLAGIDILRRNVEFNKLILYDLFKYNVSNKELLDAVLVHLLNFKPGSNNTFYDFIRSNINVKEQFGKENYELLLHTLLPDKQNATITGFTSKTRETEMFDAFKFIYELYNINKNKKVLIYGHISHLDKKRQFFPNGLESSLGNMIDKEFNSNYYLIGMIAGNGSITNLTESGTFDTEKISQPINNSLEEYFCDFGKDSVFINAKLLPDNMYIRLEGTPMRNCNNFVPINPKERMDAVFFIKNSKGFDFPQQWNDISHDRKRLYEILQHEIDRKKNGK
ncbi:MAG: hypothetical protein EOM47_11200 [Bacteroidia bacterium]|nr:hypothetical protein [Bacteroidia bacterium]